MTALSADKNVQSRARPDELSYPVDGGSIIYKGALVCLNAAGYLIPASDTAGISPVVGVADEKVDNASGADGAVSCRVLSGRAFLVVGSSLTQATVGRTVTVVDDATVGLAAATTNDIIAGVLVEMVSASSGWVLIPEGGSR